MMKHDLLLTEKTMVFYPQREHEVMEKKRELTLNSHVPCIGLIQNTYRMYRERKHFQLMKLLNQGIQTRNINLLNLAISYSINIQFELRLLSDATKLKQLIIKEQQREEHIKYILNNNGQCDIAIHIYVQDLSRAFAECDEIGYYSPTVPIKKLHQILVIF